MSRTDFPDIGESLSQLRNSLAQSKFDFEPKIHIGQITSEILRRIPSLLF